MKKTKSILWALLLLAANCQLPAAHAQVWDSPVQLESPVTGTGGTVGRYSKMLVVNGNPAMVAIDETRYNLIYVRATDASGSTWGTPVTVDATGLVGQHVSLAIVNGNPAVSYYDQTNQNLKYVRATDASGATWGTPLTIATTGNVGQYTSLCVVNGNPAISYYDASNLDLKYVRATDAGGTTWGTPLTIDFAGNVGQYTSLCIVNGNPAISYYDPVNTNLKYVCATDASGATWAAPLTVDAVGNVGPYASLAVVNGNPAISYYDQTNADLKYVRATNASGTAWGTPITIDATGNVGQYTCIAIVNGNPAISYYDNTNFDLKYVRATDASGTTWGTPLTIDATGIVGQFISLSIVNGNPAISYYDNTNGNLKYVRATDANGTVWGIPLAFDVPGSVGTHTSLALVNGNPAVSYHDGTRGDLKYVRASDASGSSWGSPVTLDDTGIVGQQTSLTVVNGNPAISYFDNTNTNLKYVRASDASGGTWGSPVTIDATGGVGTYTSLEVVNGNPAISYFDDDNGDLKYVRATSASGATWGTPVAVDATGTVGLYTSLEVVNGNPAISYWDQTNGDLKYVRANDASGTSWGTPVTVDVTGTVGQYSSISIVNGNPAISYYDNTNGDLKYVRATDVSGTTWGTALTIDATGNVGTYTSLSVVNGNPAISYYDFTNQGLKYARATDASGTTWGTPAILDATSGMGSSMVSSGADVYIGYYKHEDVIPGFVHGTTNAWTGGAGTTAWATAGNWSMGAPPASTDNIGLPAGLSFYPDISTGTISLKDIIVNSGATVLVSGGTLQLTGGISNAGTLNANGGSIVLNGTTVQNIKAGTLNVSNLTVNNSAGATITSGTLNVLDTYTPTSGVLATGGNLVLKSTVSGTARVAAGSSGGGYITGNVTAERYQPGKRCFRFYAHPFTTSIALSQLTDDIDITGSGGSTNGFTATSTNNPSAYWFDVTTANSSTSGSNPGWTAFTNTDGTGANSWDRYELLRLLVRGAPGEGLTTTSYTPSASTFEAAGALNQGTQTITLTKGSGTNFVGCGNPFASGVQMQNVAVGGNIGANYYAWDATSGVAGAYVTNAWSLSYVLPAYAAFFTTLSATDNIVIEEADKASGGAALFKGTAQPNWVELLISDSTTKWDRLLINLDDNAMDVEDNPDGKKLYNPGLDFFTLSKDDVRLAVDVRPYADSNSIPLGLTAYTRYNRYVIRTGMYDIPVGTKLFLHDKYLNKSEELKAGFEYWFDVTTDSLSQGNQRFEINMVGKPTGITETTGHIAKMQLVPNPAYSSVKLSFKNIEGKALVRVINVTGKVVYHAQVDGNTGSVIIPLQSLPSATYIVEMHSSNARFSEKLIKE